MFFAEIESGHSADEANNRRQNYFERVFYFFYVYEG